MYVSRIFTANKFTYNSRIAKNTIIGVGIMHAAVQKIDSLNSGEADRFSI